MLLRFAAAFGSVALGACAAQDGPSPSDGGRKPAERPSEGRLQRLVRGVNVSHWFAQGPGTPHHLQTFVTADDVRRIKRMGFRHVRLPLDPVLLFQESAPETLAPESRYFLDDALKLITAEDLAIVVDLHPDDGFKARLAGDPSFAEPVGRFWTALARHLSAHSPELLFLEALNEPRMDDPTAWGALQQRLVTAMRQGAPAHTLIATGGGWSGIPDLATLQPVADRNVLYTFHFYEPYAFTHQGAGWGGEATARLRGVPYPLAPGSVETIAARTGDERALALLHSDAQPGWDKARIESLIEQASVWGRRHDVLITCSEFGVYRPYAAPEARAAWLRDVRTALDRRAIGWTHWDYAGGFGTVTGEPGRRVIDAQGALALGLTGPMD